MRVRIYPEGWNTLAALSLSGHLARRKPYLNILMDNVHQIPSCYPYRQLKKGESNAAFVGRKAAELEAKFQELRAGYSHWFCG